MFAKVEPLSLFGVAGMFELMFGGLLILGLFSRVVALSCAVKWRSPISSHISRAALSRC